MRVCKSPKFAPPTPNLLSSCDMSIAPYDCDHSVIFNDKRVTAYQRIRDSNLTRQSIYLFRCSECALIQAKQAVSEDTPLGPRIKILTYYPKNLVIQEPKTNDP